MREICLITKLSSMVRNACEYRIEVGTKYMNWDGFDVYMYSISKIALRNRYSTEKRISSTRTLEVNLQYFQAWVQLGQSSRFHVLPLKNPAVPPAYDFLLLSPRWKKRLWHIRSWQKSPERGCWAILPELLHRRRALPVVEEGAVVNMNNKNQYYSFNRKCNILCDRTVWNQELTLSSAMSDLLPTNIMHTPVSACWDEKN